MTNNGIETQHGALYKSLLLLLAFNGITAVLGGIALITNIISPDIELLRNTLFSSFVIPGILLTVIVGGSALAALLLFIKKHDFAALVALLSGFIMDTWILAEMLLIVEFSWFQILYLITGIGVVILSAEFLLSNLEQQNTARPKTNNTTGDQGAS